MIFLIISAALAFSNPKEASDPMKSLPVHIEQNLHFLDQHSPKVCGKYSTLSKENRVKVWTALMSEVAKFESNHKPDVVYYECNKKSCPYKRGCIKDKKRGYCMKGGHSADGGYVIS